MKIINTLLNIINNKRRGFQINEVMSGEHEFVSNNGQKKHLPFEFSGTWGTRDISKWIDPSSSKFLINDFTGTVTIGGLCKDVPFKGRLELKYFSENKLRYIFDFSHKNKDYHYVGEKVNIRLWNLPVSHTTCFGVLTEKKTGKLISRSVTHFRLQTIPKFLASLRFV
jgi:hypothetical protein